MAQDTLLGFPAHTLPFRRGEFTTLSTVFNCITVLFLRNPLFVIFYPRFQRPFCFSMASHISRRRVS